MKMLVCNVNKEVYINGSNRAQDIANSFADHFGSVYHNSHSCADDKITFYDMYDSLASENGAKPDFNELVTVESVELCLSKLKLGKAGGPDDLCSEHIQYAHPSLVLHLVYFFRFMFFHGLVPDDFGAGTIIPLVKDKTGDINDINNYRGITLIPVISKLFELVLLNLCESLLYTDNLQFGFKRNIGCNNALFTVRSTIDFFNDRGSSVYAAALDLHKAFDSVDHSKLFSSLITIGMQLWIIDILVNWYSKLFVAVRWNSVMSNYFSVVSGVRQGSSLSPAIFNVFINVFITSLRSLAVGCCVNNDFLGCVLYADDILLMSASVAGLQAMLNCCFDVSCDLNLKFNCKKSYCMVIGASHSIIRSNTVLSDMCLGHDFIPWTDSFKYLGLKFCAGKRLKIDSNVITRKFFAACNCILGNSSNCHELLRLALQESYCLPILQYGLTAVRLSATQLGDLNAAWNSMFRKIFGFHKHESVRSLIHGLGRLDFKNLILLWSLRFYKQCFTCSNDIIVNSIDLFSMTPEYISLCVKAGLYSNLQTCAWYTISTTVHGAFSESL